MAFIALLWRLVRRRWVRQMLLWLVVRLLRLFGWRRAVKLAFRERRHWRTLAVGAWRAAVGLLRVGRAAFILLGWLRPRVWRPLRQGTGRTPCGDRLSLRRLGDCEREMNNRYSGFPRPSERSGPHEWHAAATKSGVRCWLPWALPLLAASPQTACRRCEGHRSQESPGARRQAPGAPRQAPGAPRQAPGAPRQAFPMTVWR